MSNFTNLGSRVRSLEKSNLYLPYSKVILNVSDEISYTVGDDTGRTMETDCPYGTEETAKRILARLQGYRYQPVKASAAVLDPAAELGDGISVGNIVAGLYSKSVSFGTMYTADVSAPGEEKINYQYKYKSTEQRKITRDLKHIRSEFRIQADQIDAKVSRTGGDNSTFGWNLQADNWSVYSGGTTVFKITKDLAEFAGKILAKSGEIGGFTIKSDCLSSNGKTWGGSGNGVYIGPQGLHLGNFKVDSAGNLNASSGTFSGNVYAGNIQYGETAGYFSGSGISERSIGGGRIAYNTITTGNTSAGINTSLGYADYANSVFNGYVYAQYLKVYRLQHGDYIYGEQEIQYLDHNGNKRTAVILTGQK